MNGAALRIGLIGPLPPPSGGMANQTLQLAALLGADGHQVETIQVNAAYRPNWVANIKGLRALFRMLPYLLHLWQAAGRVDLFHVMANSGWSWHLYAAPAVWIGRMRRCPVVINYRGGEADQFLASSLASIRPSLKRADAVIVPSGFLQAVFGKYGFATTVVPNIVDLERFRAADAQDPARAPSLLVARNLEPIYDNATALHAFAIVLRSHPQARMVVAGSGPLRGALELLAQDLGIAAALSFTGRVDNAAMGAMYRASDLMINPSLVDNMPNSVLEALASGVPVVSTDVGGVPYMVEHGKTALLVPPGDPQAMAEAIVRVLEDAPLARSLRDAGLRYVQQYAWQGVRPRLLQVYRAVLVAPLSKVVTHS